MIKEYDVVLINPYWSKLGDGLEHLGLGYMASCLRVEGLSVLIVDLTINDWTLNHSLEEISQINCSLIGVSIPFQEAAKEALDFISKLRKVCKDTHITIGGIYPSFSYREIMDLCSAIDTVVLGEGELTIVELVKAVLKGGDYTKVSGIAYRDDNSIKTSTPRSLIPNLDNIPFPARDTLDVILNKYGFASMITTRGCYGRCNFCSVDPFFSTFGPKYRLRSWENVIEEMNFLYTNYGVRNFMFNDANFIGGKGRGFDRAKKIAEEILRRKWDIEFRIQCRVNDIDEDLFTLLKEAGLTRVYLGIESGSQTILDRFQKDATVEENLRAIEILSKLEIFMSLGFIMFDDKINTKELNENLAFLQRVKAIVPQNKLGNIYPLSKLLPLAGTEVEKRMKSTNNYKGNSLDYNYSFDDPVIGLLYNCANFGAKLTWAIKRLFNSKKVSNKDWIRGWREIQ